MPLYSQWVDIPSDQTITGVKTFAHDGTTAFKVTEKSGTWVGLNIDTTNKRVGIGTATPAFALDVVASGASCNPTFTSSNAVGAATAVTFTSKRSRGSVGSEAAVNSGDTLATYSFQGHTGSAYRAGATIQVKTLEAWDGTHGGTQVVFQSCDTASISQSTKLVLSSGLVSVLSSFLFQPAADAATALQFQDSATTVWLNFDSTTGRFGFGSGNTSPTSVLDVADDRIRVRTAKTPANSAAAGNDGDWCYDSSFFYVHSGGSWRRTALSTF